MMEPDLRAKAIVRKFPDRQAASLAAAGLMAAAMRESLVSSGGATVVVSGGSTPKLCFEALSAQPLDWSGVHIVPSDERWVPAEDMNSNERLIRNHLVQGRAAQARILPFYRPGIEPSEAPGLIKRELAQLVMPFSCCLLGMGEDGHFASLFPDFDRLDEALDPMGTAAVVLVRTAGSPYLRISLTLAALLNCRCMILLFFGEDKLRVFEEASAGGSGLPVESLLFQDTVSVNPFWAP